MIKILYVNPSNEECGIYQFGKRVYNALKTYLPEWCDWELFYYENYNDVNLHHQKINEINPNVILYSYNSTALPFATSYMKSPHPDIINIAICHEQEQFIHDNIDTLPQDWYGGKLFKYWVGHDPTMILTKENCFNATRPILRTEYVEPPFEKNGVLTFGNSTFGFKNKLHVEIVNAIQKEYDEAIIRFNMPPSHFGDKFLHQANQIAKECEKIIYKTNIKLFVSNILFKTEEEIIEWLSNNDINIYFYEQWDVPGSMRGVSSSPDNALSTRRPLIVNKTTMMKHLNPIIGSYGIDGSIKELVEKQKRYNTPQLIYNEWSPSRMTGEYYKIIYKILKK